MKKRLASTVALSAMLFAGASQAWFGGNNWGPWNNGWDNDYNPYDEWDPRYWMEEMEDMFDDDDYYYGPYGPVPYGYPAPYGYGPGPYGYAPPPPPPGFVPAPPPGPAYGGPRFGYNGSNGPSFGFGGPNYGPNHGPAPYGRPPVPPAGGQAPAGNSGNK